MAESVKVPSEYGDQGDHSKSVPSEPNTTEGSPVILQSDEELARSIWSSYERCKSYKHSQVRPEHWKRWFSLYNGQHWFEPHEPWQATPTINFCWSAVQSIIPVLTASKPQIAVIPRQPEDEPTADLLREVINWLWEENNCDALLPRTLVNTLVVGNGFWKVIWDPRARKGLGDIRIINVDPANVFVNPEATSIDDCTEFYHLEQIPLSWLEATYPDKVGRLTSGVRDPNLIVDRPQVSQRASSVATVMDIPTTDGSQVTRYYVSGETKGGTPRGGRSCTVCEAWRKDMVSGKWRLTIVANNVVLRDEMTDVEHIPFIHFVDNPVPWSFWATGEVQHVESLQYEINRRRGMILDVLLYSSMPMLVVDPASGVDVDSIQAVPGTVIPADGGPNAVSWLVPQMDLAPLFHIGDRDKQDLNDILGNVDVLRGQKPLGVEAGIALEYLGEAASTRMRMKVRFLEASLRRAGKILIQFIRDYYTTERIFRIVGGEFAEGGVPNPAATLSFFSLNKPVGVDESGNPILENTIPPDAEYDVRIGAGSTLPVSKTARFQMAITLYDRGAIDAQELLRAADWPRWEEVMARMEQAKAAAMGIPGEGSPDDIAESIPENLENLIGEQEETSEAPQETLVSPMG